MTDALLSTLEPLLGARLLGLEGWQVLGFVGLLLVALVARLLVHRLLVDQLARLARRLDLSLPAELLDRVRRPLAGLLFGLIFQLGVPSLKLGDPATATLLLLARALMSVSVILIASNLLDLGASLLAEKARRTETRLDDQVIPLTRRAAKVALWGVGVVFVAQNLGVDVASLVAGLGLGGLAIALAAKDTVENFFGSITIFADQPFQIGDWVVMENGTEGVVLEVGFRTTRIRTFHDSVVSVPNGKFATAIVDNMGRRRHRRVKTTLGLTYGTPTDRIAAYIQAVESFLRADPAVADGTLEVHLAAFGASSLDVMVYYFLDVPDWHAELKERGRHFLTFIRLAEETGVSFAFPSTSLYVERLPAP